MTTTEQRTHFAFWCMLAAPLILGNDPRHMTRATLDILLASEIVALNQDPLGKQARKVRSQGAGAQDKCAGATDVVLGLARTM